MEFTPLDEIQKIRDTLGATFYSGTTRPITWRQNQLHQLARMIQDEQDRIVNALQEDLGRPKVETLFVEVAPSIAAALRAAAQLPEWAKAEHPEVPDQQKSWNPTIYKAPKGTVLLIAPWNIPLRLAMQPLIGAIAAGCTAVLKLSELAPTLSQLLAEKMPQYLDPNAYRVVNGAVPETSKLLELQWDHIFFTGNSRVARIIAGAAAVHLTPMSLELGGKNPVIIDSPYDLDLAAKRILWSKCSNAGQMCVAPDYILVERDKQDDLVRALQKCYSAFYPEGALDSPSFGSIVSDTHYKRLTSLLARTNGQVVLRGQADAARKRLELTIVKDVVDGDSLLEEEIFGPLLPIVPVDSVKQAIEFVNARAHALVLYAFSENESVKEQLVAETQSGAIVFNDTVQQLMVEELPFAGVGESGYGCQIHRYTFDAFTHLRSSIDMPKEAEPSLAQRYLPLPLQFVNAPPPVCIPIPPRSL